MRKYIAELLGTALIVFVGTGAVVFTTASRSASTFTIAMAFAFAIMAAIYAFGDISGGHFNPAVSFAMAINKRLSWNNFIGYVVSQVLGAILGSSLVLLMLVPYVKTESVLSVTGGQITPLFGEDGFVKTVGLGQTDFSSENGMWIWAIVIEALLTFLVVLVIMNLTSSKYTDNRLSGMIIALVFAALIFVGAPFTGASLNPARSIAPAIFVGGKTLFPHIFVYIVGPMLGAAVAAFVAKSLLLTEAASTTSTKRSRSTAKK